MPVCGLGSKEWLVPVLAVLCRGNSHSSLLLLLLPPLLVLLVLAAAAAVVAGVVAAMAVKQ